MNEDLLDLQYKQSGPTPIAFNIRATRVPMKFTTINTLNDDILLFGIFNYYRLDNENAWNMASPRILLGIPPGHVYSVHNGTRTDTINRQDESAIHHALLLRDRIRHISLHLPPSILHKFLMLIDEPFSILEHLSLSSTTKEDTSLVLPKTFLAPDLRHLSLLGYRSSKTVTVASPPPVSLATLPLTNIRASGYFLPRPLMAHLESLHQLEELYHRVLHPHTPSQFQGVGAYLECFVAQIRAPLLERLDIMLFNQLAFVLPHLSHFINTTEAFKLPIATVSFGNEVSIITDRHITQQHEAPFTLRVMCKELD
ncbi:hypothetical protein EDB83DRAFT_2520074 [Lactarius deliciosus]|nr:hypothetical protein EDB83DRAFT_2520074 [Lactarius deliciosus]